MNIPETLQAISVLKGGNTEKYERKFHKLGSTYGLVHNLRDKETHGNFM
jgi:hypothetical protein